MTSKEQLLILHNIIGRMLTKDLDMRIPIMFVTDSKKGMSHIDWMVMNYVNEATFIKKIK